MLYHFAICNLRNQPASYEILQHSLSCVSAFGIDNSYPIFIILLYEKLLIKGRGLYAELKEPLRRPALTPSVSHPTVSKLRNFDLHKNVHILEDMTKLTLCFSSYTNMAHAKVLLMLL